MYNKYTPTKWKEDGTRYGESSFNNIEQGIQNLETYAKYREKQARNMAKAVKKVRTGKDFSIAVRGDSIQYGFQTLATDRCVTNTQLGQNNVSEKAKEDGLPGVFWKSGAEITYGSANKRMEVQPPHTLMDALNLLFGDNANITYYDNVMTADSHLSNYYRYDPSGADFCIDNLGTNDALASFLPEDYVGNTEAFVDIVCKMYEREIDNGTAMICISPLIATQVVTYDTDGRACLDAYRTILKDICGIYGIPFIDGQEMVTTDADTRIDFCHYTCGGNSLIGKRMASLFVSTDMNNPKCIADEDYVGCSVQTDSINVRGNAVLDYSEKSPNPRALLDNNDLYDQSVNLINSGLCVMVDYPLEEALDRTCASYAVKNCGKTPDEEGYQDAYDAKYAERMDFLKNKHIGSGYVTWSFYADKENTVVIPSVWIDPDDSSNTHEILAELDFATLIPSTIGNGMKEWSLDKLQTTLQELDPEYTPSETDTVEDLAERIKPLKWTASEDRQQAPSNIFNYLGEDTLHWGYEVSMTTLITDEDVSSAGYYGLNQLAAKNKAIVITTKGWHTISLKSNNGCKFMAFGLSFLPYRDYKNIVK